MSMSNALETALLELIYKGTAWANYADNASVAPEANIAVALHTADPGDAGTMATSEAAYTSYARRNVARGAGWTVTGDTVNPAASIDFPIGTGGGGTATHFSTGRTGGGAAAIHVSGTIAPNLGMGTGLTPKLAVTTAIVFA